MWHGFSGVVFGCLLNFFLKVFLYIFGGFIFLGVSLYIFHAGSFLVVIHCRTKAFEKKGRESFEIRALRRDEKAQRANDRTAKRDK